MSSYTSSIHFYVRIRHISRGLQIISPYYILKPSQPIFSAIHTILRVESLRTTILYAYNVFVQTNKNLRRELNLNYTYNHIIRIIVIQNIHTIYRVHFFSSQNIQKHEPARTMSPISENKWKLLGSRKTVEETFRNSHRISMLQSNYNYILLLLLLYTDTGDRCVYETILGRISIVSVPRSQIAFIYIALALLFSKRDNLQCIHIHDFRSLNNNYFSPITRQ